jgi:hypothetical protein
MAFAFPFSPHPSGGKSYSHPRQQSRGIRLAIGPFAFRWPSVCVRGRSKPASEGRIKTSQFEVIIIGWGAHENETLTGESTQIERATINLNAAPVGPSLPSGVPGYGNALIPSVPCAVSCSKIHVHTCPSVVEKSPFPLLSANLSAIASVTTAEAPAQEDFPIKPWSS